jgi:tRNA (guanine37-N1)-methyltransferase
MTPTQPSPWRATVLTLFPQVFPGVLQESLAGKALSRGLWSVEALDIRGFARDKHATVDDAPFGGGPGMVMRPDVIDAALASLPVDGRPQIFLTPAGRRLDQQRIRGLAAGPGVVLLCGRYEGVDARVIEARGLEELSLCDFVLSGGEIAALAVIDACVRLLPGVVGDASSVEEESFARGLLEYPHYTRPQRWCDREIPGVLISGHHEHIKSWRLAQSEALTRRRRPDLWARYVSETTKKGTGR